MTEPVLIAIDWGTSNFRAFLIDEQATVISKTQAPKGIRQLQQADYGPCLWQLLGSWLKNYSGLPIIAAGMVGSKNGLYEMPYLSSPCDLQLLAKQLTCIRLDALDLFLVPGCKTELHQRFDVMRGEETQLLGASLLQQTNNACFCLPGTHSKWASLSGARLNDFTTYLTGELFTVLFSHTILGQGSFTHDSVGFERGLAQAEKLPSDLLGNLFSVRSQFLQNNIEADQTSSFLSGLLIGHEILAASAHYHAETIYCIGEAKLIKQYQQAFTVYGLNAKLIDAETASIRGLYHIAKHAQLIT